MHLLHGQGASAQSRLLFELFFYRWCIIRGPWLLFCGMLGCTCPCTLGRPHIEIERKHFLKGTNLVRRVLDGCAQTWDLGNLPLPGSLPCSRSNMLCDALYALILGFKTRQFSAGWRWLYALRSRPLTRGAAAQ